MFGILSRGLQVVAVKRPTQSLLRCVSSRLQSTGSGLEVENKDQVLSIKLARPDKFNAITRDMYEQLTDMFEKANSDKSVKAIVLTGTGDYYSSGNDLSNFTAAMKHPDGFKMGLKHSGEILFKFVNSLINLEKFLIAVVNGPAVGIAVTTLPLCDYVIASDKATFQTPFTGLGMCPEACSSYTLPSTMGRSRSSELLLLNMVWDAKKAREYGLISEVVENSKLAGHSDHLVKQIVKSCYPHSLRVSKTIVQSKDIRQKLMDINRRECDDLVELWCGEECMDAVKKFFERSKK